MLLQLERPAVKGPGHVEGGIAVFEAPVAERHDHVALGDEIPVEIGDAIIGSGVGASFGHARLPSSCVAPAKAGARAGGGVSGPGFPAFAGMTEPAVEGD